MLLFLILWLAQCVCVGVFGTVYWDRGPGSLDYSVLHLELARLFNENFAVGHKNCKSRFWLLTSALSVKWLLGVSSAWHFAIHSLHPGRVFSVHIIHIYGWNAAMSHCTFVSPYSFMYAYIKGTDKDLSFLFFRSLRSLFVDMLLLIFVLCW